MPELPEVEVVRRGIHEYVVGKTISKATARHPRAVRRQIGGAREFAARLSGRSIIDTNRRGKFLWLVLDNGQALVTHLGMSGQVLIQPITAKPEKHLRVRCVFTEGENAVHFVDQRTFGWMNVEELGPDARGIIVPESAFHIAQDPLDPLWDKQECIAAIRKKPTQIKRILLDQTLVSGIGNIYADEALWLAKIHWATPASSISKQKLDLLLTSAQSVMRDALAVGGTSFDALYVNVNGESGYFSRDLNAYGREDEPCSRCGRPIVRDHFMNRSSFSCPKCQQLSTVS
ncbi:MAG: bifunctional DNA-formamidopyrimidine glycosylase/DNA-(apurinic or apyrimidinic site) lyase [Actinobacteria bacterium]|nr:bifunctional DNA-formamidopyrimidine glycosylase/DNA-(apurinic or apyrimidinic site) lyase [Actinomycetota bacterium]NBY14908.1 bifunctional DNA-formamidopyrimidine glycosylase/DNA-(apurinic or apyrimidinic site) lyase [Actinomycetota bacterium]